MAYNFALQAAFFAALATAGIDKRITGGVPAQVSEFPYIVKVGPYCGGSLLDSTTVLTAAHCWSSYQGNEWVESPAKPGLRSPIVDFIGHPDYYPFARPTRKNDTLYQHYWGDDIAILKLSTPLEGGNISYAKLPARNLSLKVGSMGVAAGWGEGSDDILQKVELPILDSCKIAHRRIPVKNEFCVDGKGKGGCPGDSGGPFVDKNTGVLLGVANSARCGIYTSFTRVSGHISFIEQYLVKTPTPSSDLIFPTADIDDECNGGKLIPGPPGQGAKCVSVSGEIYEPTNQN